MSIHAVSDVKIHLGVSDASVDSVLSPIVDAIEGAARKFTGRELEQVTVTAEKHVGSGRLFLDLREYPAQSVTQLKIGGTVIAAGSSSWEVHDAKAGRLYRPGGWEQPGNAGQNNIEVTYVAGYAIGSKEAKELKLALVEWSAARFRVRNKVEMRSEAFADHSASYWDDMPGNTKMILSGYKRVMS